MLTIIMSAEADTFLDTIPRKHAEQITKKIVLLSHDPSSVPSIQLHGYPHLRRAKSGEYRIIYSVHKWILQLHILRVGKRNDGEVYRNLGMV